MSTVRRHLAAEHKKAYRDWCKANEFESMLKEDIEDRKNSALALKQSNLDGHVIPVVRSYAEAYSHDKLRRAMARWVICTDQVSDDFD